MVSSKDVSRVANLARIKLSPKEIERFGKDFSAILEYFEILKKAKVTNIEPMIHSGVVKSVMREDKGKKDTPERLLNMSSNIEKGFIKVKSVLE